MSNETSARVEGESGMDKSEGVKMGEFGRVDPSSFPMDEKFTIYRDDENDFVIQSQRETGLVAHGDTPEEAVYNMREVLDMAASLGYKPEPKVGESGLSDKQRNQPPWVAAASQDDTFTERPRLDFWGWWRRDGNFYDPDTEDVPWFDKRKFLAEKAFDAGVAQSTNYIADREIYPRQVSFANGRVVSIRWENEEAFLEVILNEHLLVTGQSASVRKNHIQLTEAKPEPLPNTREEERLIDVVKEYRESHINSLRPCVDSARCSTCKAADELLASSKGKRMVQACPKCRKPIWGEGGNPKTGVRYFSHTTREDSDACCEEIEIHPGEKIRHAAAPKVVGSKEEPVSVLLKNAIEVMKDAEDDIFGGHSDDALDKLRRFLAATDSISDSAECPACPDCGSLIRHTLDCLDPWHDAKVEEEQ